MTAFVVEANAPIVIEAVGYTVQSGARLMAYQSRNGAIVVTFCGYDVHGCDVSRLPGDEPAKRAEDYSAARLEQYQLAPKK